MSSRGPFRPGWPLNEAPHPSAPMEIGVGFSGSAREVTPGPGEVVLDVRMPQVTPGGQKGVACVHVSVRDVTFGTLFETPPNSQLLLDVTWNNGIAGGEFTLDATQGAFFAVNGYDVIKIVARLTSAIAGEALKVWATKRVEASVQWYGGINPKATLMTTPMVRLTGLAPSAWLPIPAQAMSMLAQGDTPAAFAGLTAEFSTNDTVGAAGIKMRTLNPNANGTLIAHGVNFVRFNSADAQLVGGVFELWT